MQILYTIFVDFSTLNLTYYISAAILINRNMRIFSFVNLEFFVVTEIDERSRKTFHQFHKMLLKKQFLASKLIFKNVVFIRYSSKMYGCLNLKSLCCFTTHVIH